VQALIERRRTTQAREALQPALAALPDDQRLLLLDARVDYLDDRNDAALATLRRILSADPDHAAARSLLFNIQLEKDQFPAAEDTILGLLKEFPEEPYYLGRYAQLMLRSMHRAKALALAEAGLKIDPDDEECLAVRSMVELIEQPAGDASAGLQQLLVRRPDSLRTLLLVVVALEDRGDYRGALRLARELVRAQPDNVHLVGLVKELTAVTHWSMLPLRPFQKYGWGAVIAFWVGSVVLLDAVVDRFAPDVSGAATTAVLVFVGYSWVWPPLLRYWMRRS
jgi:tetratricopeptide (TPR) repeat protein